MNFMLLASTSVVGRPDFLHVMPTFNSSKHRIDSLNSSGLIILSNVLETSSLSYLLASYSISEQY